MRQFRSSLEFDQVVGALEVFSLEPFAMRDLDSADFALSFGPVTFIPEDLDDEFYCKHDYDDDDERGLRSQAISIIYAGQPIGSFTVREHEREGVVVAVASRAESMPAEYRLFVIAWFQAFQQRLVETVGGITAPAPLQDDAPLANGKSDSTDRTTVTSSVDEDYLAIIAALKGLPIEQPSGPSANPYIRYYYLCNILEAGSNLPRQHRTTWDRVREIYDASNPEGVKDREPGYDPTRTMREIWKGHFDKRHPVFREVLERVRGMLTPGSPPDI